MTTLPQQLDTLTGVIATLLMIVAGMNVKRLRWRSVRCPVCGHRAGACSCRHR